MPMIIDQLDVVRDRAMVREFLAGNLDRHGGDRHLEWLYHANPAGEARVWVARDGDSGESIGIAAAFPREVYVRGERRTCWNLGDFAIRRDQRALGPAVKLQRACLAEVMDGGVPFAYDHPHSTMMPIYRWMKIATTGQVVRYAKPLRVDEKVGEIAGARWIGGGVSVLGNVMLRVADMTRGRTSSAVSLGESDRVDERFDELDRRLGPSHGVIGCRDAAYLRWRYADCPVGRYEMVTAARDEVLQGYVVYQLVGTTCRIVDLYCVADSGMIDILMTGVVERGREKGAMRVSLSTLAQGRLEPALRRWGFRPREATEFVVSTQKGGAYESLVTEPGNWYLTYGDRDV